MWMATVVSSVSQAHWYMQGSLLVCRSVVCGQKREKRGLFVMKSVLQYFPSLSWPQELCTDTLKVGFSHLLADFSRSLGLRLVIHL